jgi:two-component system chemotaxis sensor kinase CheA
MIEECMAFSAEPGHDYTNLRGEVLPFHPAAGTVLGARQTRQGRKHCGAQTRRAKGRAGGGHADGRIPDRDQAAGQMFAQSKCISGSTILGSGDVALILDVPQLVRQAMDKGGQGRAERAALA